MKIRLYAAILLLVAGVLPLVVYGALSIHDSKETTIAEARYANSLLAQSAADRIADYLHYEATRLEMAGSAIVLAKPEEAQQIADASLIAFPHWHNLTVVGVSGETMLHAPSDDYHRPAVDVAAALQGSEVFSKVRATDGMQLGSSTRSLSVALPLHVLGVLEGAVLAELDLTGIWAPIQTIRVGKRGFLCLVSNDGTDLAHGRSATGRDVFARQDPRDLLEHARKGDNIQTSEGEEALTSLAEVEGTNWSVIAEDPVSEVDAVADAMGHRLMLLIGLAGLLSLATGLWAGRGLVRSLESMEAHTKVLAEGHLDHAVAVDSRIREVASLAESINTMARSLERMNADARAKERITTFGRVAAGLAHDLRSPVETLGEASRRMLDTPEDPSAVDFFRFTVESELPRLRRYLDDLKHLAAEGSVGLHKTRVDLSELLEQVIGDLAAQPKWKGLRFRVEGSAAAIALDAGLLSRAIFNLAANGADANLSKGEGELSLSLADVRLPEGPIVQIEVRDTGCGMSVEELDKVMGGDFHSTKRANGVGLGYGVARHIVECHGGTITGQSELGVGTTFTVRLPREGDDSGS